MADAALVDVTDQFECCADPNPDNNQAPLDITAERVEDQVADLAITATDGEGGVGEVVDVTIEVSNLGPDTGAPGFEVVAPSGTTITGVETNLPPGIGGCIDPSLEGAAQHEWTEAHELICSWESALEADRSLGMTFTLRLDDADIGDDGYATVFELDDNDPDLSNNTAQIAISSSGTGEAGEESSGKDDTEHGDATGELAATGSQAGLIGSAGALLLLAGGAMFMIARRRRAHVLDAAE